MINLIAQKIIRKNNLADSYEIRRIYGSVCGGLGIFLNLLLCLLKFLVGLLSGSIAIMADAANNLSDAGTSIITLIGFKLSSQKPDREHPFGHGRYEYVAGFIVAVAIIVVGIELVKSSISKLIEPTPVVFSYLSVLVLVLAIIVKIIMALYNRYYGKKYDSETLSAVYQDSLNDVITTFAVLVSTLVGHYLSWPIDGYVGLAMAIFIIYSGFKTAKKTIDPLLGTAPSDELVTQIKDIVLAYPEVLGIHDLAVHNYGPGRMMISLHAEVSAHDNIVEAHDVIDNAEKSLADQLHCQAVIHMDPIVTDDEKTNQMRQKVKDLIHSIDPTFTIHDFRMVSGSTHTNLIFDMVVPFGTKLSNQEILNLINQKINDWPGEYHAVVSIDQTDAL